MDIVRSERLPRKWEWVAKQLTEHEGTEELVEIACKIDNIIKKIYGEHTHTAQHILDMRVWEKSISLATILDLSTKETNCTACSYTRAKIRTVDGFKNCSKCDYALEGGDCTRYDNKPKPLFRQFTDGLIDYRQKVDKR